MMRKAGVGASIMAAAAVLAMASSAWAISYASGVSESGGTVTFTLNEASPGVTVDRTGDTPLNLGALPKGTHTFALGAASAYSIKVGTSSAAGWTQISNDADNTSKYFVPKGVAVNKNPASPQFGSIYVAEGRGGLTGSGRTTTDGVYVMGADQSDVTGQGDAAYTGGISWTADGTGGVSPFKMAVAPDGRVYIADWSDAHSGVWRMDAGNPAGAFDEILDNTGRTSTGLVAGLHGSVAGLHVDGTGASTKLYTLDEDYNAGSSTGSVLRYDIGTATSYATPPVEQTEDDTNVIVNLRSDLVRDEDGSWWIAQYRSTETAGAPALTRFLDGGQAPVYNSGADANLPLLKSAYGNIDICNGQDWLIMGARSGYGVYIIDISDPANPVLLATIAQTGYTQDVGFDIVGNAYIASSSTETLRIWSPGGDWLATTGSDGSFVLIPEPATLGLLMLGGLALLRRRR